MLNYVPRPGSIPEQVIEHLSRHGPTRSRDLGQLLDKRSADLYAFLKAPIAHGAILSAGASGRVRVFHLPGQDPTAALQASVGITPTLATPEIDMARRKTTAATEAATDTTASVQPPLDITIWSDGDTVLQGEALRYVEGADGDVVGVMLSRAQLYQLVQFVARPVVSLG